MINRRGLAKLAGGAALASMTGAERAKAAENILVGFHGPLTGAASWVGLGARDGALMALDEINAAGGIGGRRIELLAYDDGAKASEAAVVATKMIESDKVFAILGGGLISAAAVVGGAAHSAKIPYMNLTTPKLIDLNSRWVFTGATIDARDIAELEAAFVGEHLKVKKVAVINASDEYEKGLADSVVALLKDRYGVETVVQQSFNRGDTDFSSQLLTLRRSNPDYILMFAFYVEAARIMRQARELGIKTPIKGDASMMNSGLLTVAGPAAEGAILAYIPPYYNGDPAPDMVEFESRFKKKYPSYPVDRPNYVDIFSYSAMYTLAEGFKRASGDLTQRHVLDSLETLQKFEPKSSWPGAVNVFHPISFDTSHVGNRQLSYYRVTGGKFVRITDFTPPKLTTVFTTDQELRL